MTDRAFGRPPATAANQRQAVEQWADGLWRAYERRPWILQVRTRSAPIGPNELEWFEDCVAALTKTGLDHQELVAMATFISFAVRDLARVSHELQPQHSATPRA
ncbi:TetR/AcrR family transcriptional regulator C-terminal domain-containing protein [Nonomuraea jiangxiensis]|uniref:Tetracyclin repressor, C-terminal all-alpha domain n=1 Tax=Nonomuraea jiangxiensis TaxID=633440 RepID=A0A1G9RND0_9ACTN|nr:TetR/AcrR family transcriptional regulator C-terminal domain-containing protein [Nonomuraea jiangxiensis]SDM24704.1 Tetracyclin repressor, C-terminal all-alpha domain [Nonomuraea jiangxiensis]